MRFTLVVDGADVCEVDLPVPGDHNVLNALAAIGAARAAGCDPARAARALESFEPAGRRTNLAASLSYASRLLRHRSIVVVLSDFIAEGWERPLRRLAARHDLVAITVDDPREHVLPESGWIEMQDAESGRRVLVDTGSRDVRLKMGTLTRERREERSRVLAAAGADQVHLETGAPYALPLRRAFALRARRIRRA